MRDELRVLSFDDREQQRGRDEAGGGGHVAPHAAHWDNLAAGGNPPGLDDHLRQAAAAHGGRPGHEGHYAQGLGHPRERERPLRHPRVLRLDHHLPPGQLGQRQEETLRGIE